MVVKIALHAQNQLAMVVVVLGQITSVITLMHKAIYD
jgi:hypothetical protein